MAVQQKFTLDLIPGGVTPIIPASQYDSGIRELVVSLTAGGEPYEIPTGATVTVRGTKPDHTGFSYVCTYSGSVVTAATQTQMTAVPGDVWCELRITSGEDVIGSANFILRVEPAGLSDDTDISATEIPAIEDAARTQADRAEAAAKRAEEAAGESLTGISPTVEMAPISGGTRLTITDKNGEHTTDIMDGADGVQGKTGPAGPAGADGAQGPAGADGVSPTVEMQAVDGGTQITVTDKSGSHTATILNGKDGKDGKTGDAGPAGADGKNGSDGVSPTVTTAQTETGATITIADASGAHTVTLKNGKDGAPGATGATGSAGADGVSPTVKIADIDGGKRITITDAGGDHTADIMNGTAGETGARGPAGADGKQGPAGADGVSPTVAFTAIDGGTRITITDASGTHSADIMNGADGKTGAQGPAGSNGTDGVSPTVSVAQTDTGATITITDASGPHTATIANGKNGADGKNGTDGKDGTDGKPGSDGATATVTIGTVTTGDPGTEATVANAGTSNAAVLNFVIPRGATGARGPAGPAGADGKPGATGPAYTLTDDDKASIVSAVLAQMTNAETEAL